VFIDQLKAGDRILLLYEEPEYARMLNFHYIRRGLDTGEKCIYLVVEKENDHTNDHAKDNDSVHYSRMKTRKKNNNDEDKKEKKAEEDDESVEFIKRDMNDNEIDVSHFISKGLLYIGTSPIEPRVKSNNSELFGSMLPSTFYNVRKSSSSSPSIQYRLVLDVKPELDPMKYKLAYLLELEEFYHSMFHSLLGSSICSYPVRNIEQTLTDYSEYGKLTTLRLNSHTGVIFARKFGKGLALALQ
jgi:hypothetical protein